MTLAPNNAHVHVTDAATATLTRTRPHVAIVAFGPTADRVSLFRDDPDWEIWGMNDGHRHVLYQGDVLRADRWFELHEMHAQDESDWRWLGSCPVPVYVPPHAYPDPRIPHAVRYPIERIEATYAAALQPFWACSFSYMIALALAEGFETIGLFGFEFGSPREWIVERANVLFWAGLAAGRGVTLVVPPESTLFRHPYRYGIEYDPEAVWTDRRVAGLLHTWMAPLTPRARG